MPHISKKKLNNEVMEEILWQLVGVFKLASKRDALSIINDELLTKTEKIMLAKRIAAILMLSREVPQHVIAERLHMSPSTIARLSLDIEVGKYSGILKIIEREKHKVSDMLYEILLDNLPPPFGRYRRRYQSMYRSQK